MLWLMKSVPDPDFKALSDNLFYYRIPRICHALFWWYLSFDGSPNNQQIEPSHWLSELLPQFKCFLGYHKEQSGWCHLKEHWKLNQKPKSKVAQRFIEGHLSSKVTVVRISKKTDVLQLPYYYFCCQRTLFQLHMKWLKGWRFRE